MYGIIGLVEEIMATITTRAVYQDGAFRLPTKLDLPEGTEVQLEIIPAPDDDAPRKTLFGAFPELSVLTEEDLEWAKREWERDV
jgi:predicted DNA-binding antitoxin AbrB/MazE fold protein